MKQYLWLVLGLLALCLPAFAGEVETRVNSQSLRPGETLQLHLRFRGDGPATVDTAPLDSDFDLIDQSRSTRSSVINGVRDDSVDWVLTLAPRETGVLEVPSLAVGDSHSASFEVTVSDTPAPGSDAETVQPAVIFELEADNQTPYVQGQVVLTARVLFDDSIRDGALTEPELEGALLERDGEDTTTRVVRDGKAYTQVERRYALFPQRSGTVRIPPLIFEGTQREPTRRGRSPFDSPFGRSPFDDFFSSGASPFGGSLMDDFFDRGRRVRYRSNPLELQVRPKPAAAAGAWWLPARHVQLVEEWHPDPPVLQVGEQVRRRISIQALGLSGSQMPTIESPEVPGLKQYPQPAQNDTLLVDGDAIAVRTQEFELVPTRPGELTLPAIELQWWDIEADEPRKATLPERTFTVLPNPNAAASSVAQTPPTPLDPEAGATEDSAAPSSEYWTWPKLALALAASLSALALPLWARKRKASGQIAPGHRKESSSRLSIIKAESQLARACRKNDLTACSAALMEIGLLRYPESPPLSLTELARRLGSPDLERAASALEQARFADHAEGWNGDELWSAYSAARRTRRHQHDRNKHSVLPELYPGTSA